MSKPSLATSQKPSATPLTTKSAWAKGPPLPSPVSGPTQSSRGQSPNGTPGSTPSHSRKSSAFTPVLAVKDGVSIPRGVAPSHRASPSLNFGSIDANASSPTPSNATPAVAAAPPVNGSSSTPPPTNPSPAKTFGSIPASSSPLASTVSSSTAPTASASPTPSNTSTTATSSAPAPARRKLDPHKMFQNQPTQSSPAPSSSASPVNPPSTASALPPQTYPNANAPVNSPQQRLQSLPPPATHNPYYSPQQQNQQIPSQHLRPQNGAGAGGPRSPSFSRHMQLSGSSQGPNGLPANGVQVPGRGPPGGPQQQPTQMGSPRLTGQPQMMPHPQPPQQGQPPPPVPPPGQMPGQAPYPPPQMAPGWQQPPYGWPQYQQYPPYMVPQDQWYPPHMQHPHIQHPHHHPASAQYLQTPSTPHQAFPPQPLPQQSTGQPPQPPPPAVSPRVPITALPHQTTGSSIPPTVNTNIPTPPPGPSSALRTPLTAAAREFVPGSSPVVQSIGFPLPTKKGIKITNASGDPVVLRPPDGTHNRTLSREVLDPAKKAVPVRMESEEDKKRRIAEEEAKVRKAKEDAEAKEAEKKRQEEEARRQKEEEELEAKRQVEEAARLAREEAERVEREAEAERLRKEKEEREAEERRQKAQADRLKREAEERIQKEKEAAELLAQAEAEANAKAEKEAEEARNRAAAAAAKEEAEAKEREEKDKVSALARTPSSTSITASPNFTPPLLPSKPHLPPITTSGRPSRPVPGPLDLSSTHKGVLTPSLPSALATARKIDDLGSVSYPEGIKTPDVELNEGQMKGGKYKYDRDFLLQFMAVCKDKPDGLPPLQDIGIERDQDGAPASFGRSSRRNTGSMGPPQGGRSSSGVGLGFAPFPTKNNNPFAAGMGSFSTTTKMTSEDRFRAASTSIMGGRGGTPMSRSTSQGGVGGIGGGNANAVPPSPREANRTRSQRGRQRNESLKPNAQQQSQMPGGPGSSMLNLEPVAPLQATENRWAPTSLGRKATVNEDSPEFVERKVKALLNKLTLEKFDSISDQIIAYANKSEKETNGATLIHVIKLVFEKATDEATFSEMYARLCRKMMETISPNVQDEAIRNSENKPIIGGHLFRKYLLNRCQEDFERGWSAKESAAAAAALKAADDKAAAEAAAATAADGEVVQFSEEYYAALKAKRQGLGLVRFIGELFKLQMLTERIMHECIKKLLSKIDNPEEEEIESLCKLLTTVGQSLDTPKAKNHMDIYFQRMDTLSKNQGVASRVRYMLLDVIELRSRGWQARQATAAPQTIAQIHEQAAKEKNDASRLVAMSRGGSQRGAYSRGGDHTQAGPDGWNVAGPTPVRAPAKAGDMSHFGKFTAKAGGSMMMSMGPSSVFKKGDRGRETPPPNAVSRTASSSNMFSMLAGGGEAPAEPTPTVRTTSQRGSTRKPSVDTTNLQQGADTVPGTPQRKKLQLLPRSVAPAAEEKEAEENRSEAGGEAPGAPSMTDAQATAKVDEDVKEFFGIRDLEEGAASFEALPDQHKSKLVDKLISRAMDGKESDVKLVADLFARVAGKACPPAAFETSFGSVIEYLDDMAIDIPQAYPFMARLLRGSKLPQETVEGLAAKIAVEGNPALTPKDKLLKAYANLA